MKTAFTFDDFLLVPDYSEVERNDINIASSFFNYELQLPVISSPMDTVTGKAMMEAMYKHGGLGVHHRYCALYELITIAGTCNGAIAVSPSFGIDNVKDLLEADNDLMVVLDVAHGDTKRNMDFCDEVVNLGVHVVSGNICTTYAAKRYHNAGVNYLRVGVGAGSVCITRLVTGVGYPQAQAIKDISEWKTDYPDMRIISDGGHRTTGDIVKALALGADFVMLGGMLAGTDEAEGGTRYRGMASKEALSTRKKEFFVEGISKSVEPKGSVEDVLKNIKDAIEQACYYTGSQNLSELREANKVFLTNTGHLESYVK